MNKNIWIDCGVHMGLMTRRFIKGEDYNENFELYAFDIAPRVKRDIVQKGIKCMTKAVWIEDGEVTIFVSPNMRGTATGIYPNKKLRTGQKLIEMVVPSIDFSRWLIDNFDPDDNIILKMDIEGAEFLVLNKMFDDGSINYIDKLYLELHSSIYKDGFDFDTKQARKDLIARLENLDSLELLVGDVPKISES